MNEKKEGGGKAAAFLLILVCFILFGGVCFAAGSLLWRQGQEMEVSIETSGEGFTSSVTFTVSNVLGMDILIDESRDSCAMLQFLQDGEWVDVCEIRFVREDSAAISVKYGGMYAHLEPGKTLTYCFSQELLGEMVSGEYRVAIPYISEEEYLRYLQERGEEIDESLEEAKEEEESAEETSDEESLEESSLPPEEIQAPEIHVLYEEFVFVGRQDTSAK
jgi:hypothetical protein